MKSQIKWYTGVKKERMRWRWYINLVPFLLRRAVQITLRWLAVRLIAISEWMLNRETGLNND